MALRFRKSVKVAPGIRLNFSKSGVSTSIGGRGARVNISKRGVRTTAGLPGTGISYSQLHKGVPNRNDKPNRLLNSPTPASPAEPGASPQRSNIGLMLLAGIVVAGGIAWLSGNSDKAGEIVDSSSHSAHTSAPSPANLPSNADTAVQAPVARATQGGLTSAQAPTRYVQPKTLNVRGSPNGAIARSVERGDAVTVYLQRDGWSRISPDGQPEQWVSSDYLCERRNCSDIQTSTPPLAPDPSPHHKEGIDMRRVQAAGAQTR